MKAKWLVILTIFLIIPSVVNADGCFFHHYYEDVREPSQKAVIFYNESSLLETLILQVKYEGNASDFGWVVPTPMIPELDETDGDIFYELSLLTSNYGYNGSKGYLDSAGEKQGNVTLLRQEQVGIYNASVLNATDASALLNWVQQHGYAIPDDMEDAVQYYINKGWCFTAIKIDIPAYIKNKIETYQEIDERITNLSDAEKYLTEDLIDDILSNKSYNESVASKLGIPNDDDYHDDLLWGYEWLYKEYWGWKSYEDMKRWMYTEVRYLLWEEIRESDVREVLLNYGEYGIDAIDEYDLVDRICYQIYNDIKENKSYNNSIASISGTEDYCYDNWSYNSWKERYDGRKDIEELKVWNIKWIIRSIVRVEDTEKLLRRGGNSADCVYL